MTEAMSEPAGSDSLARRERRWGAAYAFGAYVLWGILPLYFLLLAPTSGWEIVGWRILLSLVFCILILIVTRAWRRFVVLVRDRRVLALTAVAGALIYVNWQVYILAALAGHVVEASLGYFINPIVTMLLGVLVLHERLRWAQWGAIALAVAAVSVIVVGYGSFPVIAVTLALSFGFYGLVKKRIGPSVDAVSGLTLESAWLSPVAVIQLVVVASASGLTLTAYGPAHEALLLLVGAVTAVPLLLFASGARRVPLTVIGMLQFVAPILQFATGVWLLGEPMPAERWIGFALVWVALALLTVDSVIAARRGRPTVAEVGDLT